MGQGGNPQLFPFQDPQTVSPDKKSAILLPQFRYLAGSAVCGGEAQGYLPDVSSQQLQHLGQLCQPAGEHIVQ